VTQLDRYLRFTAADTASRELRRLRALLARRGPGAYRHPSEEALCSETVEDYYRMLEGRTVLDPDNPGTGR